jgi:ABC-type transport system involved in Fe-S cluster assembly fused permease/ATPase subunit
MSLDMGLHLLVLRCLSPFTVILGAVLFSQIPACFIDPSKRTVLRAHQRAVSQCLTLLILSTYIVEAFLFLAGLICLRDWTAVEIFLDGEDGMGRVVYTLLCFFIWLFTYHLLCDPFTEPLFRFACVSTWILATSMDTTISLLSAQSRSRSFDYCQVIVQISRFVCLTIICVYNFPPIWNKPRRGLNRQPPLDTVLSARTGNDKYHDELPGADTPVEDGIKNENLGKHSQEQLHRVHQLGGCPNENPRLQRYVEYMFLLNVAILLCPRLLGDLVDMINHMREDTGQLNIGCLIKVVKILNDTILKQATRSLSLRVCRSYKELGLSLYFHDNEQAGKFQAAIEEDLKTSANLDQLFRTILPLSLEVCIASAYLAYLFDVYLGLILLSTYIFYGVFTCSMTPLIAKERRKDQATHRIQRTFYQSIANWMSCFYFNRRDYQRHRVKESTQQELREVQRSYQIGQLMQALQSLAVLLSYGALLFRVAYLFKTDDRPVAKFLSPLWFHIALTAPLHKLEQVHNLLIELCVDTERLLESITVTDAEDAKDLVFKGGKVEFRNIGFSYDGLNPVIKDLSFEVKAGSTVAFVGQSESGKTTTCDKLLLRGYDVTDGSIFVDGQDIRTVTQKSLRETIGIVRQKQSIYNDTVMEVVRYTRLDATDEEVVQACKDAAIHEGILKLPKGYDSKIGEHGVKLPGAGQRLIAIAQLFLRDPKIFVLDEATASVDSTYFPSPLY